MLDPETPDGIIGKLMDIDAKRERVLRHLDVEDEDDAEEDGS